MRVAIERELAGRPRVTVLVPETDQRSEWQPLLHRGAGQIALHLHHLRRVTTVVLPVRLDLDR